MRREMRREESNAKRASTIPSRTAGVNTTALIEGGRGAVVPLAISTLELLENCQYQIEILILIVTEAERIKTQCLMVRPALAKRDWMQVEAGLRDLRKRWNDPLRTNALRVASRDDRLRHLPKFISRIDYDIDRVAATRNKKVTQEHVGDVAEEVEATVAYIMESISIVADRWMDRVWHNLNDLENELVVLRRTADEHEASSVTFRGAATVNHRSSRRSTATAQQERDVRLDRRN
jgi:hypothetical protein